MPKTKHDNLLHDIINHLKRSGVRRLHFDVFSAIQI